MGQMSLQLQQKKASFIAGMEPQWQPKKVAFSVGSNRDKGTSNGMNEECEEFSRMFCEKLQEFAMILTKKYHYNFPVEYFDDYQGSFNKEEFLKVEQKEGGVAEMEEKNVEGELREYSEEQKEDVAELPIGANGLFVGKPSYEDIKGLDFLVFEQPKLIILSGHVERKKVNELHSHLRVGIKSSNDPSKIESTFPLPSSNFFQVKDLLRDKLLLQFQSAIPSSTYRFEHEVIEVDQVASIEILSQIMSGMDFGNLRTKKKR